MNAQNTQGSALGRSWKLWGGVLALIVVAIIVSFFIPAGEENTAEPQDNQSPPTAAQPAPTQTGTGSSNNEQCPSLSTNMAMPTEAPDTEWQRHPVGMIAPTSEEHGPALQDSDFWGCYSRTPSGALFAGLGMLSNISAGHAEAATDSPNREAFTESNAIDGSEELPIIEDFRIIMANEEEAVIEHTFQDSQAKAYIQVDLAWSAAREVWRLNLEGDGQSITGGRITDPSSYISWR